MEAHVSFSALMNEATKNLNTLNSVKGLMDSYDVESIHSLLKNDEISQLKSKNMLFIDGLEKMFSSDFFLHPGQDSLKTYLNEKDAYLQSAQTFHAEIAVDGADTTDLVVNFIDVTNSFAQVVTSAIAEVNTEISDLTGKVSNEQAAIRQTQSQIVDAKRIISDELEGVNNALDSIEANLNLALTSKTSGASAFVVNVENEISAIEAGITKAENALDVLRGLTTDNAQLNNPIRQVAEMKEILIKAQQAILPQVIEAAQKAVEAEHKNAFRNIEQLIRAIDTNKAKIERAAVNIGKNLEDAKKLVEEERLTTGKINKIEICLDNVKELKIEVESICEDAGKLQIEAKADVSLLVACINDLNDLLAKADQLKMDSEIEVAKATKILYWLRVQANLPTTPGEFFSLIGTVPVKQYRKLNWATQKSRAIFGSAMLISFLIGAINWSIAVHDLTHSLGAGIIVGIAWFFLVSMVDRLFVLSMDKQAAKRASKDMTDWSIMDKFFDFIKSGEILFMSLRLVVIFFSTLIVSEVITANLYDREIKSELVVMKAEKIQDVNKLRTARIAELNGEQEVAQQQVAPYIVKFKAAAKPLENLVEDQRKLVREKDQDYNDEYNGIARSGKPRGDGKLAKLKKAELQKAEARLHEMETELAQKEASLPEYGELTIAQKKADAEIKRINALIKDETANFDGQVAKVKANSGDGLDNRMTALKRVSKNSPWPTRFMILLFIIEAIPLIGKILIGKDEFVETMATENELSSGRLRVRRLHAEAENEREMANDRVTLIEMKKQEYVDAETLNDLEQEHKNKVIDNLVNTEGLHEQVIAMNNKRNLIVDLVARQKEIDDLLKSVTPVQTNQPRPNNRWRRAS